MKSSELNVDINYSLNNNENYLKNFPEKCQALDSLSVIVFEYIKLIFEKRKMKTLKVDYFVIIRGLETIINVYLILLYNTNNIELSFYHTHRSYIFYLEFVDQITDEQHKFLQLTSRDATMYVYKKTIFDVKRDMIENAMEKDLHFKYLNSVSQLFRVIGTMLIKETSFEYDKVKKLFNKLKKNNYTHEEVIKCINLISQIENNADVINEMMKIFNKM